MGLKHAHEILNVENSFNISSTFILDCQFSQRRSNFAGPKLSDFPVCYNLLSGISAISPDCSSVLNCKSHSCQSKSRQRVHERWACWDGWHSHSEEEDSELLKLIGSKYDSHGESLQSDTGMDYSQEQSVGGIFNGSWRRKKETSKSPLLTVVDIPAVRQLNLQFRSSRMTSLRREKSFLS